MKPKKLCRDDIIRVCAPSGIVSKENKEDLLKTEKILNNYRFKVKYSKNLYSNTLKYSATIEEKSSDLNSLINDNRIKAVIFAKGGSNSNSILDRIDYELIKKNPKFFVGFSDNTVLLNAIYKKTDLITYHFTNFKGFCNSNDEFNKKQFEKVMMLGCSGKVEKNSEWITIRPGKCSGKLIGGNLSSFVKLLNTKYCPNFKNSILFLEDLSFESNLEMLSSYLYQLKQSKVFEQISGLLLGNYDSKEEISFGQVVLDVVNEYNFPIVKCDDFGYTNNNIVLPIGIKCILDADNMELIYQEKTVI